MKDIFKVPKALSYNGDKRNWNKFKQSFDIYMKATGLVNTESENKVNIFLNIAGDEALEIYNSLKLTCNEKKNFDCVIEAFEDYISSKQNVIYKSFKFFTRVQQPGEFFVDFYNDLQVMADFCLFGDQKDRLIRDRIIAGIRNRDLQTSFLKAPDLSLEEVVNKCVENEAKTGNNVYCKVEMVGDETVNPHALDAVDNNNYEELLNNETNIEEEFSLDVPDEILFNEISAEEAIERANVEQEEWIGTEDSNDEEYGSMVEDVQQNEIFDVKPIKFEQANSKNKRSSNNDSNMQSTSVKKEKLIHRKKKAEVIQMKIAEIKEKLSNDIKKEVGREQMGIFQKFTRSRVKQFSVKQELHEKNFQKQKKGEFEASEIVNTFHDIEEEEDDPYACEDDPDYEIDTKQLQIVQEDRKSHGKSVNDKKLIDNVDTEAVNEMAEVEYLAEKEMTNTKFDSVSTNPRNNKGKRGKGRRNKDKKLEIIELKRDNLPPLILKTIKKKTLLIGKMPYPCKKCDSSFWTSLQLERHQLVHVLKKVPPANNAAPKKVFKCEVCSKEFKKICDLERHTRVHTGEKPSVCNICNKRFQQAYNLHKHLLTHTQEKNYECIICQKRFGRSDVLNRHVLTHSIDKPFHCSICLKTFIRSSQLKLHLRKHHGMNTDEADKAVALATPASTSQEECPTPYSNVQDNKDPVPCTSSEQTEVCAF